LSSYGFFILIIVRFNVFSRFYNSSTASPEASKKGYSFYK